MTSTFAVPNPLIACHECDLLNRVRPVPGGGTGRCARCRAALYRDVPDSIATTMWLSVAAAILFVVANIYPILTFKLEGREQVATIVAGSIELYRQGFQELGILVICLSFLVPLARIAVALYLLVPVHLGRVPWHLGPALRYFETLVPWAMSEVYLLGLIVAYVKLSDFATLVVGPALYAFGALIVLTTWASITLDHRILWNLVGYRAKSAPAAGGAGGAVSGTAAGHVGCHHCDLVVDGRSVPHASSLVARCPRCGGQLHRRKSQSLSRAWAFLIAAVICYVPANVLPIMTVISFGQGQPDTILSGVKALIGAGMYPVALIVFVASIFVPVLKIVVLAYLMISVHRRAKWRRRERTVLFRITEASGRWSMVDIFMISILAALVKLGSIATIEPGAGAIFFAAVVVLTMLAAEAFDPRLIWDAAEDEHGKHP